MLIKGIDMKNIKQMFFTVMFLLVSAEGFAAQDLPVVDDGAPMRGIIETHNAIESSALRISLKADLNGFVEGKVCDLCETIIVTITPQTKAYANNIEVPLEQAKTRLGQYATVIFERDTKNVSEIRW
jgi:CBS-domain-containing membrane protein